MADARGTMTGTTDELYKGDGQKSAGRLMKEVTEDLSTLVRKEIELAKQEVGSAVSAKVAGAAMFAVIGVFLFFALIFLLLAVRDGFDEFLWTWLADIATAGVLILIGVIVFFIAKKKLSTPIKADLTKKTIKDDVEWAKNLRKG